jgi:acyl-CoA synthetase (AMP-forming)/AMP-acid ligase II
MKQVLDWLEDPADGRGVRFAEPGGGWRFQSYRELAGDAYRVAALLRESRGGNVSHGGAVALMLGTAQDFMPAFVGVLIAGLTAVPVASPQAFGDQDKYVGHVVEILRAAQPSIVVCDDALREVSERASALAGAPRPLVLGPISSLPRCEATPGPLAEVSVLQFTSGSSGAPKGVRVSPDNLAANVEAVSRWIALTPDDSLSSWLPLYHDLGLAGTFLCSLIPQLDLWVMSPKEFIAAPGRWLECHGRHGATVTAAPSFGYGYAARKVRAEDLAGMDFSGWRVAITGAERVDPRAAADFASLLRPFGFLPSAFCPSYGLAEATLTVSGVAPGVGTRMVRVRGLRAGARVEVAAQGTLGADRPDSGSGWLASCGPPVSGMDVHVVGEDGSSLPEEHVGEITVSGPLVALGYHEQQPGTASEFSSAGLRTGDSGFMLDGEVYVVGRLGDSMKVRGRNVHAEDVEAELVLIQGIRRGNCLVALGDAGGAPQAIAVVESADTGWLDGAVSVLRASTAEAVRLTVVRVPRGGIPRTTSGKPRRRLVWRQFQEQRLKGDIIYASGGFVPDITETGAEPGHSGGLATSTDLYRRWESQQWSVAGVDPGRDMPAWQALSAFLRRQLLASLAELEVGEVTVTRTLAALACHPPGDDDRIFLCTQMADEARHVRFFQAYLEEACGVSPAEQEGRELAAATDYMGVFAPELVRVTAAARDDDPAAWYRALVYYHLITEGVLAATGLRATRSLARRLKLTALSEGLANVIRDESRHVSFGLRAAAGGVDRGYAQIVADAHFAAIGPAAWVMIGPGRRSPVPALRPALMSFAAQLRGEAEVGEQRLLKQLRLIGLAELCDRARDAWRTAIDAALDGYEQRWDAQHPIRAAERAD